MAIFLGLGSNHGDRREHLRRALAALAAESIRIERISPVVESPALLPADAPPDWNKPFLNLVVQCASEREPAALLAVLKTIETRLGRTDSRRWAPRPIDIDILVYDELRVDDRALRIPHPGLTERAFFLTPLVALAPRLAVPGQAASALELSRRLGKQIPLWMGIVNVTPDSFSDGGENRSWSAAERTIDAMIASGVHILDFGAESTRPGATPLTPDHEWQRLEPVLTHALDKLSGDRLRPAISVDTYHADVAGKAIGLGVDLINDVGGLTHPDMLALAAASGAEFIAMHNLGLPVDPGKTLAPETSAVDQVERWLDAQIEQWSAAGLDLARIVFDPGVGFGKTALQSLELLRGVERFKTKGLRVLIGHSRKSFMQSFSRQNREERDLTSIGGSLALCNRGVDILRVHNVADHDTAYRGWAHLQP